MTSDARIKIALSRTFITILPSLGFEHPSNAQGRQQLLWAVELGKPVIVWRLPHRRHLAIPDFLRRHHDWVIIDGARRALHRVSWPTWTAAG